MGQADEVDWQASTCVNDFFLRAPHSSVPCTSPCGACSGQSGPSTDQQQAPNDRENVDLDLKLTTYTAGGKVAGGIKDANVPQKGENTPTQKRVKQNGGSVPSLGPCPALAAPGETGAVLVLLWTLKRSCQFPGIRSPQSPPIF
ncbi:predicted protein [Chaetomium globosum CBS 148.51]|uniref:Uncharacterized protein n=1 Tax=Chaetomium globosum (strain ATCC 6205 / CBS 148.51 / DSM 1962 / NBRC 6347 / NRRL 1970) TaxID=306901 RepID=Q2HFG3_CHAGB|nr:uncharacterized protein CHGG_01041 [Chaetomium globosum CBS 148.51]EAQ92806.1 predicted protein [Chaetomium globosum CBS 148.51]